MRLLIIRHGDPDYSIDGLTEKGKREAKLLAERLCREDIAAVYCSALGRARLTIAPTLSELGITAEYCLWLREFNYAKVLLPYLDGGDCCWDILPEFVDENPSLYLPDEWMKVDFVKNSKVYDSYNEVCRALDAMLEKHGYARSGKNYIAKSPNHDTVILVCHFGLASVLLSHLLNCSPYSLWQHTCLAPTSVTTLYTEERRDGRALFRAQSIGDISHLYKADEEPAFAARFCECFTDDTRHD